MFLASLMPMQPPAHQQLLSPPIHTEATVLDPCEGIVQVAVPPLPLAHSRLALARALVLVCIPTEQMIPKVGLHP